MPYNHFNDALPDGSISGVTVPTDARKNFQAMRDMIVVGGMVGWNMSTVVGGGSAEQPDEVKYNKGIEWIKGVLTWGTTGGSDGNVAQVVYWFSANNEVLYEAIGTYTITYDVNGNVTAAAWS